MHPLLKSKPRLAVLFSMVFLLQCCCCILPVRWQVDRDLLNPNVELIRAREGEPARLSRCASTEAVSFAWTSEGGVVMSVDGEKSWQAIPQGASIPAACSPQLLKQQ